MFITCIYKLYWLINFLLNKAWRYLLHRQMQLPEQNLWLLEQTTTVPCRRTTLSVRPFLWLDWVRTNKKLLSSPTSMDRLLLLRVFVKYDKYTCMIRISWYMYISHLPTLHGHYRTSFLQNKTIIYFTLHNPFCLAPKVRYENTILN